MSVATETELHQEEQTQSALLQLVQRPKRLADTGLSMPFAADLLSKHLMQGGALTLNHLVHRIALPTRIVEDVLHFLRKEARVEILPTQTDLGDMQFGLTDRGRALAAAAMDVSGYVGAAPVPLAQYVSLVAAQSVHDFEVTAADMAQAFKDVVVTDDLLNRLGPSLNSGRAIFIYGPAGTGKTYLTQRFARVFGDSVFIPRAILINEAVLTVFDPVIHKATQQGPINDDGLAIASAYDQRFVLCKRPAIVVGGELTADMLEVQFDSATNEYAAPLQMKANNGIFIIDDMGRQRVSPMEVFNRWIVPLEEKRDYLTMGSGRHFSVPFNVVLVFSTNMKPTDLADEAFLRRIGYKIEFPYLTADQYTAIWRQQCRAQGVPFDEDVLRYALRDLHAARQVPLLPCHPRDLIGLCLDQAVYKRAPRAITTEILDWAWENYFANTDGSANPLAIAGEVR